MPWDPFLSLPCRGKLNPAGPAVPAADRGVKPGVHYIAAAKRKDKRKKHKKKIIIIIIIKPQHPGFPRGPPPWY